MFKYNSYITKNIKLNPYRIFIVFFLFFYFFSGGKYYAQIPVAEADPTGTVVTLSSTDAREIGFPNGQTFTYTNSNFPTCKFWGLPLTVSVLNGNSSFSPGSTNSCTYPDNMTFNSASPSNLAGGVACWTGTTTYRIANGATTYTATTVNVRMVVTVTNAANVAIPLINTGSHILAVVPSGNTNFKVNVKLQAYGPSTTYFSSGTSTTVATTSYTCTSYSNTWAGAIQIYNCLNTDPAYQICSAFPNTTNNWTFYTYNSVNPTSISGPSYVSNGATTTLTAVGGALGYNSSYVWYTGSCGGTQVFTSNSTNVYTPTITANTTYYVQAVGPCYTTPCVSITVNVDDVSCDVIYVDATNGNDVNLGGQMTPVKTLSRALQLVSSTRKHIKMTGGTYTETSIVDLQSNLIIEGRYVNSSGVWTKTSNTSVVTQINCSGTGSSGNDIAHVMGFRSDADVNWKLIDLNITTANASGNSVSGNGVSNYGVYITNSSTGYLISRCVITSGNATSGNLGASGVKGGDGIKGNNGCNAVDGVGYDSRTCGGTTQTSVGSGGSGANSGGNGGNGEIGRAHV